MNNLYKNNKGFTLIEIIISIGVFSIIVGAISLFARNVYYFDDTFSNGLTSYDESRKVLQPIASEIRSASSSSLGSYPIEKASNTEFVFFADIDSNGSKEKIRYFLVDNILKRGVIIPTGSPFVYLSSNEVITDIIHGVNNGSAPIFSYYDSSYTGTSSPLSQPVSIVNIRLVKINLIVDANPSRPPAPVSVTTQVSIRNLKDNL